MTNITERIYFPFAENGDKEEVSPGAQQDGKASWEEGWTAKYSLTPSSGGYRVSRVIWNKLFNVSTGNIKYWQENLIPEYFTAEQNSGVPVRYNKGAIVKSGGLFYKSLIDVNTKDLNDPASWAGFEPVGNSPTYIDHGSYLVGDIVKGSDGKQYYCNKINNLSNVVDPVGDISDTWREFPFKKIENANGKAYLWFNGYARATVYIITPNNGDQANGSKLFNLPITFKKIIGVIPMPTYGNVTSDSVGYVGYHSESQVRTFVRVFENPTQSVRFGTSTETCVFGVEIVGDWV